MIHRQFKLPEEPFLVIQQFAAAVSAAAETLITSPGSRDPGVTSVPCMEVYYLTDAGETSRRLKRFRYPGHMCVLDALARAICSLNKQASAVVVRVYSARLNRALVIMFQALPPSTVLFELLASGELERNTWIQVVASISRAQRAHQVRHSGPHQPRFSTC